MECKNCGAFLEVDDEVCPYCGQANLDFKKAKKNENNDKKIENFPFSDKNATNQNKAYAIICIVLSATIWQAGLVASIIGFRIYKSTEGRILCAIAFVVAFIRMIFDFSGYNYSIIKLFLKMVN